MLTTHRNLLVCLGYLCAKLNNYMAKEDDITVDGKVIEMLPGAEFMVQVTTEGFEGHQVRCKLSGKMRMNYIKIVPGDGVSVVVSPYNIDIGRITYRLRNNSGPGFRR